MCAGPSFDTGLFARPHLLQLMAQLASMLNLRLSALSATGWNASPMVGLQASMGCLLSAAASLLEAARLLEPANCSGGDAAAHHKGAANSDSASAPADHVEAADLINTLPLYLSLACEMLQGPKPAEVCRCVKPSLPPNDKMSTAL